jgi:Tfp pilus assembly protein PilN
MKWETTALGRLYIPQTDLYRRRREEIRSHLAINRKEAIRVGIMGASALSLLIPMAFAVRMAMPKVTKAQRDAMAVEKQFNELKQSGDALDTKAAQWAVYQDSRNRRSAWSETPLYVAGAIPPTIFLEQFQIDTRGAGEKITLSGAAQNVDAIQTFRIALENSPLFTGFAVQEASTYPAFGKSSLHFRMQAKGMGRLSIPKPKQ